jgi:hypothetical protein
MKRPIGLILASTALSLSALVLLLLTAATALAGIVAGRPSSTAAMPHFAQILVLSFSFLYAALAVWAILTVIGILRLQSWARYSILIIGGGLAGIGALMALGTIASRTMLTAMSQSPALDPHRMAKFFAVMIAMYLFVTAIGIWWLIYFNLRSTRDLFLSSFTTAQSAAPDRRPIAITILGCLFLLSAVCCAVLAFLPLPAFMLGFIFPARASHFLYLAFALITAFIAYGLFSLKESARLATIGFLLLGVCNMLLSLLPSAQERFRLYAAQISATFSGYTNQSPAFIAYNKILMLSSALFTLAFYAVLLWLLHRHRSAFTPTDIA